MLANAMQLNFEAPLLPQKLVWRALFKKESSAHKHRFFELSVLISWQSSPSGLAHCSSASSRSQSFPDRQSRATKAWLCLTEILDIHTWKKGKRKTRFKAESRKCLVAISRLWCESGKTSRFHFSAVVLLAFAKNGSLEKSPRGQKQSEKSNWTKEVEEARKMAGKWWCVVQYHQMARKEIFR